MSGPDKGAWRGDYSENEMTESAEVCRPIPGFRTAETMEVRSEALPVRPKGGMRDVHSNFSIRMGDKIVNIVDSVKRLDAYFDKADDRYSYR